MTRRSVCRSQMAGRQHGAAGVVHRLPRLSVCRPTAPLPHRRSRRSLHLVRSTGPCHGVTRAFKTRRTSSDSNGHGSPQSNNWGTVQMNV